MRCFIAFDLPEEVKDYLFKLQREVGEEHAKVKWVAKKQLHQTLKFLGEVSEKKVEEIKERFRGIKFKSFEIGLEKLGVFPDEKYIRIVWVGLKPAGKVIELQQKIDSELLDLFRKDERFSAHVTLGRVKFVKDKERFIEKLKGIKVESRVFKVENFKMYKSELTKDGPIHKVLEIFY